MKLFASLLFAAVLAAPTLSTFAQEAKPAAPNVEVKVEAVKAVKPDLAKGEASFTAACAACHGADGKGNQALGAPNLTDDVWLHGYGENAIIAMVNNGKVNQMPAQADKLTDDQLQVLSSYVWGLSNNVQPK